MTVREFCIFPKWRNQSALKQATSPINEWTRKYVTGVGPQPSEFLFDVVLVSLPSQEAQEVSELSPALPQMTDGGHA